MQTIGIVVGVAIPVLFFAGLLLLGYLQSKAGGCLDCGEDTHVLGDEECMFS